MEQRDSLEKYFENYLSKDEINFNYLGTELIKMGQEHRALFMEDLEIYKLRDSSPPLFTASLIEYFRILCFFPDENVITKFRGLGFPKSFVSTFIPLSTILKEFEKIREKNIYVVRGRALLLIVCHIQLKLNNLFLATAGLQKEYDGKEDNNIVLIEIKNYFRRRKTSIGLRAKRTSEYTKLIEEIIDETINKSRQEIGDSEYGQKMLIDFSSNRLVSYFLKMMVNTCFTNYEQQKLAHFHQAIYELIRLLMVGSYNPVLLSEEEFDKTEKLNESTFSTYVAKRMRQLFPDPLSFPS